LFLEDFYPLLDFDTNPSAWVAFQFHSPGQQTGIVQAFRGTADTESTVQLKIQAVQRDKRYVITNWDQPSVSHIVTGAELLDDGLTVSCAAKNGCAVVITYRPE
jgi:alpha-galactosidase